MGTQVLFYSSVAGNNLNACLWGPVYRSVCVYAHRPHTHVHIMGAPGCGSRHTRAAATHRVCGKIPNSQGRSYFLPCKHLHLLIHPPSACWASAPHPPRPRAQVSSGSPQHHPSPPGSPQGRTPAALLTHPPAPSPLSSGPPTSVPLNSKVPSTHCSDLTLPPHHGLTHLHCLNIPGTLGAFEPRVNSKDTHTAALHSSLCCPPTSQAQLSKVLVLRRSPLLGLSRNAPSTGSVKRPPCHLTPPSPPHSPQGIQAPTVSPRRAWSKHRTLLPGFSAAASAAEKPARALKPSPGPHGAARPLTGLQGPPSLSE